jgi:hypothetical protein
MVEKERKRLALDDSAERRLNNLDNQLPAPPEPFGIYAGWCMALPAFRSARQSSWR